jgi:hypothetical protein
MKRENSFGAFLRYSEGIFYGEDSRDLKLVSAGGLRHYWKPWHYELTEINLGYTDRTELTMLMAPSYHVPGEQTWVLQYPLDDHPRIPGSESVWAMKEGEEKYRVGIFHNRNWLLTLTWTQLLEVHCHCKRKKEHHWSEAQIMLQYFHKYYILFYPFWAFCILYYNWNLIS